MHSARTHHKFDCITNKLHSLIHKRLMSCSETSTPYRFKLPRRIANDVVHCLEFLKSSPNTSQICYIGWEASSFLRQLSWLPELACFMQFRQMQNKKVDTRTSSLFAFNHRDLLQRKRLKITADHGRRSHTYIFRKCRRISEEVEREESMRVSTAVIQNSRKIWWIMLLRILIAIVVMS